MTRQKKEVVKKINELEKEIEIDKQLGFSGMLRVRKKL